MFGFVRQQGTLSAKLNPTDPPGIYDAKYVAAFRMGGKHITYVEQIKANFKTIISGDGKSIGVATMAHSNFQRITAMTVSPGATTRKPAASGAAPLSLNSLKRVLKRIG